MLAMPRMAAPNAAPDDRAVAAGQQAAADDGRDDEDELAPDALVGLDPAQADGRDDAEQRGGGRGHHEERDLGARDRDADVARGHGIAADGVDPVAEAGAREQPRADDREADPPDHVDLEVVRRPQARGEERARRVEARRRVDAVDRDGAGDLERAAGVDALEDEERPERDDEARQLGLHHRVAVDEADRHAEHEHDARSRARRSSRPRS